MWLLAFFGVLILYFRHGCLARDRKNPFSLYLLYLERSEGSQLNEIEAVEMVSLRIPAGSQALYPAGPFFDAGGPVLRNRGQCITGRQVRPMEVWRLAAESASLCIYGF